MTDVSYSDFTSEERKAKLRKLNVGNIVPFEAKVVEAVANNDFATIDLRKVSNALREQPFTLEGDFIKKYEGREPKWGELGWFTFKRTYARRVEKLDPVTGEITTKRTEEWTEVVRRVVEGNMNMIKNDPLVNQEYAQKMYHQIWNLAWTPPGRGLWMSGSAFSKRSGDALNNCWFVQSRPYHYGETNKIFTRWDIDAQKPMVSYPFVFLFDMAMKGGGVGFSAEDEDAKSIPAPTNEVELYFYLNPGHKDFAEIKAVAHRLGLRLNMPYVLPNGGKERNIIELTVADSREGWAETQAVTIDAHYEGTPTDFLIDLSEIRERDTPIRGFGGVASGSAPLVELLAFYNDTFNRCIGKGLTPATIVDLHNATGKAVVAGNVRRTAEVALASPYNQDFIDLKNYTLYTWLGGWRDRGDGVWEQYENSDEELLAQGYSLEQIKEARYAVWAQQNHRWASNNSVVIDDPRGYQYGFISGGIEANGEPGVLQRWLMQNFGRVIDGYREQIDGRAIGGNPCMEISLESGEPCNLVEGMLPVILELGLDIEEVFSMMVQYAKRVTFGTYEWELSAQVIANNRRIGVSFSGFMDWVLLKFGKGAIKGWNVYELGEWHDMVWLDEDTKPVAVFDHQPTDEELSELHLDSVGYQNHKRPNRAKKYFRRSFYRAGCQEHFRLEPIFNQQMIEEIDRLYKAIVQADIEYSAILTRVLGFEVKPSIKKTTVKPSGTVALLPGISPGVHAHYFGYGIRRIQVQKSDPLLGLVQLAGYHAEPYNKNPEHTWVIEFPFKAPTADFADFRSIDMLTIEEQFAYQAVLAIYWADNMVSCTITFHEHEKKKIRHMLEQYRMRIKSTSLLPYSGHGYLQAPYEPYVTKEVDGVALTPKEQYEKSMKKVNFKPQELYHILMAKGEFEDSEMTLSEALECAGGHCPVR